MIIRNKGLQTGASVANSESSSPEMYPNVDDNQLKSVRMELLLCDADYLPGKEDQGSPSPSIVNPLLRRKHGRVAHASALALSLGHAESDLWCG